MVIFLIICSINTISSLSPSFRTFWTIPCNKNYHFNLSFNIQVAPSTRNVLENDLLPRIDNKWWLSINFGSQLNFEIMKIHICKLRYLGVSFRPSAASPVKRFCIVSGFPINSTFVVSFFSFLRILCLFFHFSISALRNNKMKNQ